jgi:hypothetical protein
MTPAPQEETQPVLPGSTPDDADDLRGFHFRELLHKPLTWALAGGGPLLLGVVFLVAFNAVAGLFILVLALALAAWVTWKIADSRAADDFFDVYATSHDLELGGKMALPAATPLLRKGDERYAERTLNGAIAPGVDGFLALFTYVVETTDSNGSRSKAYHPFTLGVVEVPECVDHVPELYCRRKGGLRSLERFEDVFRRSKERVTLESEALGRQYEIFSGKGQDATWLRRVLSPTFIVWLTESTPDNFAFELVDGTLVTYLRGHLEDSTGLDAVAAATGLVATRLREKSAASEA